MGHFFLGAASIVFGGISIGMGTHSFAIGCGAIGLSFGIMTTVIAFIAATSKK